MREKHDVEPHGFTKLGRPKQFIDQGGTGEKFKEDDIQGI